ncbi:hypothetical protein VZT92_014466 [Zoarces viviparus]|uniref:Uncharacterized protein n=1 Tax=Zoarces viviparus TaxID=48416 RepID=A0AAW1EZU4_ZOAVI
MRLTHHAAPAKCLPRQRSHIAMVMWVDYQRAALMPRTGGLGVAPTSADTRNESRHTGHRVTGLSGKKCEPLAPLG